MNVERALVVRNFAAQIATGVRTSADHITPSLKQLLGLPVAQLLGIRDIVLIFNCVKRLSRPIPVIGLRKEAMYFLLILKTSKC